MRPDFTNDIDSYLEKLAATLALVSRKEINGLIALLLDALEEGRRVFVMGNGGSAASATHIAVDFNKGLSYGKARRFRVISLSDNLPTITAYANDVGYEDVFVEQLKNFLEPGDLVIAISGSGNSRNVVKAVEHANAAGAVTFAITGYDGGALKRIARHGIHVAVDDMQVAEDAHMVINHMLYSILYRYLPAEANNG